MTDTPNLIYIQKTDKGYAMYSSAFEINYGQWTEAALSIPDLPAGKEHVEAWKYTLEETDHGDVHVWEIEL